MRIDNNKARFLKKYEKRLKKVLIAGFVMGVIVCFLLGALVNRIQVGGLEKKYKKQITTLEEKNEQLSSELKNGGTKQPENQNSETLSSKEEGWALVLINETYPLDTEYRPELAEAVEGKFVDARILSDLSEMLEDAVADGMQMYVCSAYRDYQSQWEVFNTTMVDWINQGKSPLEAYEETKKSVAVPGTSEHASGLALDIVSTKYGELDDKQAETEEAKWLAENCWRYGFILRYPPEKSAVTGIVFEPWHYRYVGKEAAKEIKEKDITLEEYLSQS